MIALRPLLSLAWFLAEATPVFAHRPYERPVGNFQRDDGASISIARHYEDGILFADPVSILFRLADGTEVAKTSFVADAVLRHIPSGIEIYQFETTSLPIASKVERFDGYALKDITSSRRLISPLIHTADHWLGYLIAIGVGALFIRLGIALRTLPNRFLFVVLKIIGFGFISLAGLLYLYDIFVFEPLSPLVLVPAAFLFLVFLRFVRRNLFPTTAKTAQTSTL